VKAAERLSRLLGSDEDFDDAHSLELTPAPRSVSRARHFLRDNAPNLPAETAYTLELLASELITNAVMHARTPLEIHLLVSNTSVVVAVHDLDLGSPLQDPYADREGGWGLSLVAALAHAWSIDVHAEGGKTAWFQLIRSGQPYVADGAAARHSSNGTS